MVSFFYDATFYVSQYLIKKVNMKIYLKLAFCVSLLFLLCATTCDDDLVSDCDLFQEEMSILKNKIDLIIDASVCSENTECKSIAFGSKPCGGPWSYLVYFTSIDEEKLQQLVSQYNETEALYNINCDAFSDCMFVGPPNELACEDGKCVIVN